MLNKQMQNSNILIYQTEDGQIKIQTRLKDNMYLKKIGNSDFLNLKLSNFVGLQWSING